MTKRKSKGKRGSTADFPYGEFPFLDGVPSADAEDARRYKFIAGSGFDFGFIVDLALTKEDLDAAIDAAMKGE